MAQQGRQDITKIEARIQNDLEGYKNQDCCPNTLCRHLLESDLSLLVLTVHEGAFSSWRLRRALSRSKARLLHVVSELVELRRQNRRNPSFLTLIKNDEEN